MEEGRGENGARRPLLHSRFRSGLNYRPNNLARMTRDANTTADSRSGRETPPRRPETPRTALADWRACKTSYEI